MVTRQDILITMSATIGKIEGTLDALTENQADHNDRQDEFNERLLERLDKQDAKIGAIEDDVKATKNKALGASAVLSAIIGFCAWWLK